MRPVAEQYVGSYVKAVHDFHSELPGELSLSKGDIFQVTRAVDNNWLHGKNKDSEGDFPTDFVEKLSLPPTEGNQRLFAATEHFRAQQDGDLAFAKGSVIVGIQSIDDNWWRGQIGHTSGIFPLTHVMEIEGSKLLRQRSKSVHSAEPLFAQALVDSVAQLDDELSFSAGDIIQVTEVIDEDWYMGEAHNKTGMFLATCVQLLNESTEDVVINNNQTDKSTNVTISATQSNISSQSNSHINDHSTVSEPSTTTEYSNHDHYSTVSSTQGTGSSEDYNRNRSLSYTSENTKSHNTDDAGVTPYGRTLYPFVGEVDNELSFSAHDIVTLIQHIDEQWIEGEIDGKIGIFPVNYVEIVVDCPYIYDTDKSQASVNVNSQSDNLQADSSALGYANQGEKPATNEIEAVGVEKFALVLYSFQAETSDDLSVNEGDTVTVIKQVDDNWLFVKDDHGEKGMCPVTFVEIIGASPEFPQKVHNHEVSNVEIKETNVNFKSDEMIHAQNIFHDKDTLEHNSESKLTSAIKSTGVGSVSSKQIPLIKTTKPPLKPKPQLAQKPVIKSKPLPATAKPWGTHSDVGTPSSPMSKSASSKSLMAFESTEPSQMLTKAQSMFEINRTESEIVHNLRELGGSNSESTNSLSTAETNTSDNQTENKKAFEDWDLTRPLDSILQTEFQKAKVESKSKNILQRSTTVDSSDRSSRSKPVRPVSWVLPEDSNISRSKLNRMSVPNYSHQNFYSKPSGNEILVGNSTFFTDGFVENSKSQQPKLRKPPRPVSKSVESERVSRKPAPPRPTGPRIAPLPPSTPLVPSRSNMKTVPSRQAPGIPQGNQASSKGMAGRRGHTSPPSPQPRQSQPQRRPPVRGSENVKDDLMGFSPPNSSIDMTEEVEDSEAVQELRTRMSEIETDLASFEKSKRELEMMSQQVADDNTGEIHDNISFYNDNIHGLTEELNTLRDNLSQLCPKELDKIAREKLAAQRRQEEERQREEMKRKMEEKRKEMRAKRIKVIEELLQTEKSFIKSLSLIMETFLGPLTEKHAEIDLDLLFGNIEEVADISQRLLTKLEDATNGKDFSEQVIGKCFQGLAEDMKNVYAPYCRNHDDVITLIEKYNHIPELKEYIDGLLDKLRENHVVFDLEALLIKPVQRILKYPLLLNALIKATEDGHDDKKECMIALDAMTDVATAINEYKRRKDLVFKYKKEVDASISDKLAKLSLHSIKKKSSRIRERFSANLGFIDQTRDANFDREETRYRHLDKTVKVFIKDVQVYMDQMQDIVSSQDCVVADIDDLYGEKCDTPLVQKYQDVQAKIQTTFLPNFQTEVKELVMQPLDQLILQFEGPNKVIQKRYDKLLDFDNLNRKVKDDKVLEKAVQEARQTYEALNAQLLDELPRLYTLAFQLFQDCVGSFVRAQREFTDTTLHDMYPLLDLQVLSEDSVIEVFNIKHTTIVDRLALLSFMPRTFSPRVAELKPDKKQKRTSIDAQMGKTSDAVPQIDSQRVYVTQQYAASRLFRVSQTYVAIDLMDISLAEGDVVGVVIEKDPMGNKERWFVDNGANKGFVSKKVLIPYEATPPRVTVTPATFMSGSPLSPERAPSNQQSNANPTVLQAPYSLSPERSPGGHVSNSSVLDSLQEEDDMDFALDEDMTPDFAGVNDNSGGADNAGYLDDHHRHSQLGHVDNLDNSEELEKLPALYYAEFPFTARSKTECSLFEHQVVTVLSKNDEQGNSEWCYVDADGSVGYVPSSYLRKMDTHSDPT